MLVKNHMPLSLLSVYLFVWVGLAIAPLDRPTWLLENVLVLIAL